MEEKKNNKGLIWLLVILIVLVLGLVSFIIYDKVLRIDKTIPNYDDSINSTTTSTTNKKQDVKFDIIKFGDNDKNVENIVLSYTSNCNEEDNCLKVDSNKNYQEELINDILKLTCNKYDYETEPDGNKFCYSATINIDNKVNFKYDNNWNLGLSKIDILKTNEYYIIQEQSINYGRGKIVIYDLNGNQLKEIDNTTTYLTVLDENGNFIETDIDEDEYTIKLNDNKLYYAYTDNDGYNDFCINSRNNYIHIGYIDLNNSFDIIELQKVRGFASQEC